MEMASSSVNERERVYKSNLLDSKAVKLAWKSGVNFTDGIWMTDLTNDLISSSIIDSKSPARSSWVSSMESVHLPPYNLPAKSPQISRELSWHRDDTPCDCRGKMRRTGWKWRTNGQLRTSWNGFYRTSCPRRFHSLPSHTDTISSWDQSIGFCIHS